MMVRWYDSIYQKQYTKGASYTLITPFSNISLAVKKLEKWVAQKRKAIETDGIKLVGVGKHELKNERMLNYYSHQSGKSCVRHLTLSLLGGYLHRAHYAFTIPDENHAMVKTLVLIIVS